MGLTADEGVIRCHGFLMCATWPKIHANATYNVIRKIFSKNPVFAPGRITNDQSIGGLKMLGRIKIQSPKTDFLMNNIIYIVGLIVIVLVILSFLGLR